MFVCLTAGTSASLLSGSNAAGGEGGAQDDSSLPIWSRKLQNVSTPQFDWGCFPFIRSHRCIYLDRISSACPSSTLVDSGTVLASRTARPSWKMALMP